SHQHIGAAALVRTRLRHDGATSRFPALRRLTVAGARIGGAEEWREIPIGDQLELLDVMSYAQGFEARREFVVDKTADASPAVLLTMTGTTKIPPGTLVPLGDRRQFIIGRRRGVDLQLIADTIGRSHARLVREGSRWKVFDSGSPNGTSVNGHLVRQCQLRSGDELAFGDLEFRFLAGDVEALA